MWVFEIILNRPDQEGRFGEYGGRFVPEVLMTPLLELTQTYDVARRDPSFQHAYLQLLHDIGGRPSPLTYARHLSEQAGMPIYLKREDLNHTGAHKINNTLGF